MFALSPYELAKKIQKDIYEQTSVRSTVGIGENMLLAKVAMDIEANYTQEGIAEWCYDDVPNKLWHIDNLTDFWGINTRTAKKLNKRGIMTIGDLAHYPHIYLKHDFGAIGMDLHLHANGIDESIISHKYNTDQKGLGKSQILLRDYRLYELKAVLIEQVEDVFYRTRMNNQYPTTICISVGYAEYGGIRKQFTEKNGYKSTTQIVDFELVSVLKRFKAMLLQKNESVEAMQSYLMQSIKAELEEIHALNMRRQNMKQHNIFNQ
ncbi:DNA-damage repair protein [Staphylococcus cohnii subsp. cohnii]|nr:DNA-damage repair protein [Staphylococcus cohnii subsp. cohnii]